MIEYANTEMEVLTSEVTSFLQCESFKKKKKKNNGCLYPLQL
jgi:hypothetical protein